MPSFANCKYIEFSYDSEFLHETYHKSENNSSSSGIQSNHFLQSGEYNALNYRYIQAYPLYSK